MAEQLLQFGANINVVVNKETSYTLLFQFCCCKTKMTSMQVDMISEVIQFMIEHGASKELLIDDTIVNVLEVLAGHPAYHKIRDIILNSKQLYYHQSMKPLEHNIIIDSSKVGCCCSLFSFFKS
jgi:hypothetical protein